MWTKKDKVEEFKKKIKNDLTTTPVYLFIDNGKIKLSLYVRNLDHIIQIDLFETLKRFIFIPNEQSTKRKRIFDLFRCFQKITHELRIEYTKLKETKK